MKTRRKKHQRGVGITEYIIIITIVAVASITLIGMFSDRIRTIISGIVCSVSEEESLQGTSARAAQGDEAIEYLKNDEKGVDTGTYYYTE